MLTHVLICNIYRGEPKITSVRPSLQTCRYRDSCIVLCIHLGKIDLYAVGATYN